MTLSDTPIKQVEELYTDGTRTSGSSFKFNQEELLKKKLNAIRAISLSCYFLRCSFSRKLSFMDRLSQKIRSLGTITLLLNTLYSASGKVKSYCLVSTYTPVFDRIVQDHDRMLDSAILDELISKDLNWYETLDDREQVAYLIVLLRYCGGALRRYFYERLQAIYRERVHRLSSIKTFSQAKNRHKEGNNEKATENQDLDDPKHQKVLELRRNWDDMMAALKKDIEKRAPKARKEGKTKKGTKNKKEKTKKKTGKKDKEQPLDWIQLMPIFIVKKIFSYLDKKTLSKAMKVNEYWKWAIKEVQKDKKAKIMLQKSNKKLKKALGVDYVPPENPIVTPPKPRVSCTEKRLKKLEQRGAILEELRLTHLKTSDTSAILLEALKETEMSWCIEHLDMYPIVTTSKPLLCQKPKYIVKDVNLIYETQDETTDEEDEPVDSMYSESVVAEE